MTELEENESKKAEEIKESEKTEAPEETKVEELTREQILEKELEESKDKYLRLLAESENTRKRMQKEKVEMMRFSVENVILEFLSPMDNLENALGFAKNMSEETANWAKGFEMILGQFKDVISSNGITPFDALGKTFDPHFHEAVEAEESELAKEGDILEEYTKGYKSGKRTLRPSRVKVAKKAPPKEEEKTT